MSATMSTTIYGVKPMSLKKSSTWVVIFALSLCIAVSAQIKIPLPFTPIPITCQTLAIMFISAVFGVRNSCCVISLYIAEALMGFPVLSGGHGGIASFMGPSGGYIVGFILEAYIISKLIASFAPKRFFSFFACFVLGISAQMLMGTAWLSIYTGSFEHAFSIGFLPFFIGELIKALCVIGTVQGFLSSKKVS